MKKRRSIILEHAGELGCNAIAAFEPQNIFYLTGFWGEAIAVCKDSKTYLIAPKLESGRAEQTSVDCEVVSTERGSELLSTLVSHISKGKTVTDCSDYQTIEFVSNKVGKGSFLANDQPFFETRKIKDKQEIESITKSSKVLDKLYKICEEEIRTGMTERELQARLIFEAMKMGSNPPSYKSTLNPLIIAGGPNGALPHAEVSNRRFRKNDLIVVDLTLRNSGYIADATRTFALGSASKEMKGVYDIVKRSQQAGLDAVHDGAACEHIDKACRDVIKDAEYDKYFIHSTGHGIGLDVHEPPWLRAGNPEILKAGMAVTVEPGIYLENKFGVRIEDSIIVTDGKKPKNLNLYTKELVVIG